MLGLDWTREGMWTWSREEMRGGAAEQAGQKPLS